LLRNKVPTERAIEFYKKIRISSIGWKKVQDMTGVKAPEGEFKMNFIGWIVTSIALYGILLGTGSLIFKQYTQFFIYFPAGVVACCFTWKIMTGKTFSSIKDEE
jgi:hypothetical protein